MDTLLKYHIADAIVKSIFSPKIDFVNLNRKITSVGIISMRQLYFVKAPCHQSNRPQGYQWAPNEFKKNFHYELQNGDFPSDSLIGHQKLYDHILQSTTDEHMVITFGGDHSITYPLVAALGDREDEPFKVLYVSQTEDRDKDFHQAVIRLLESPEPHIKKRFQLSGDNLIFFNIHNPPVGDGLFITHDKLITLEHDDAYLDVLRGWIGNTKLYISLSAESNYSPPMLHKIVDTFKDQIIGMDIVEYNPVAKNNPQTQANVVHILSALNITPKSINIFTEDTEFLIYRPLIPQPPDFDPHIDIGWFILRGMDIETQNHMSRLIPYDVIKVLDIDGDDYMVAKTTIRKQNEMTYYGAKTVADMVLFPSEKQVMTFELINKSKINNKV